MFHKKSKHEFPNEYTVFLEMVLIQINGVFRCLPGKNFPDPSDLLNPDSLKDHQEFQGSKDTEYYGSFNNIYTRKLIKEEKDFF